MRAEVVHSLREAIAGLEELAENPDSVVSAAQMMIAALRANGKVMFCGNGGSAADAQHLAAELMGRFLKDRAPLPALALTVDTSALTAISNDYGYEFAFSRQLQGLGRPGDVVVAISTSGNSRNIIEALKGARLMKIHSIGLTGRHGGAMVQYCDLCIRAPATRTDQIQQLHITIGHILCGLVETTIC